MRKALIFFEQIMKTRSKRSEAKNSLSSKNVNLCLLDCVESIAQGIKILQKTTGGSKETPYSFGS